MDLTIMKNNSLKFRIRRLASAAIALTALMVVAACSVSYKFNMASIDYSKVKTIRIADFPNRSMDDQLKEHIWILPIEVRFIGDTDKEFNQTINQYVQENLRNSSMAQRADAHTA